MGNKLRKKVPGTCRAEADGDEEMLGEQEAGRAAPPFC